MAVTATHLVSNGSEVDATSYATASITPTANWLVLALVYDVKTSGTASTPTLTGNGLTWVQVATVNTTLNRRLTLFRAMGASPTAGAVTIDLGGITHTACLWSISEFDGVDTGGTHGSAAVVQAVAPAEGATVNTHTVTLAAFGDAANATYGGFFCVTDRIWTVGGGFTLLGEFGSGSRDIMTQWRNDNDTSVDATVSGAATNMGGIAVEIKAASVAATSLAHRSRPLHAMIGR